MARPFHPFTPSTRALGLIGPLIAELGGVTLAALDLDNATNVLVVGVEANAMPPLFLAKFAASELRQLNIKIHKGEFLRVEVDLAAFGEARDAPFSACLRGLRIQGVSHRKAFP